MVLPGNVSGRTLVEITRVLRPETKVLATSGYAQEMIEREGALPIGVTLLAKPYSLKALSIAIEQTLSSQTPHNLPGIPVKRVGEGRCMAMAHHEPLIKSKRTPPTPRRGSILIVSLFIANVDSPPIQTRDMDNHPLRKAANDEAGRLDTSAV